ncbi:MAG: MFS transporter [Spirochaetales bacterium]|nr:MFS transporter [Spirochaetales bacterium]
MKKIKMNWGKAALISLPFFSITIFWQAYDYIVPLILSYHFHISTVGYSVIMSIDNIVALLFLPLFGVISDKINSKMGRRTPLILWGTIGGLFGLVAMNMADTMQLAYSLETISVSAFVLFLIALLIAVFSMSIFRSPAAALSADCFIRPQRTKANAMLTLIGGLAGVIFAILGRALLSRGFSITIAFVAIVMVIVTAVYMIFFRENKAIAHVQRQNAELGLTDEKTQVGDNKVTKLSKPEFKSLFAILGVVALMYMGYNAFGTHYSNYLTKYLLQDASWTTPYLLRVVLILIFAFPAAALSSKIGRRKSALIGMIIIAFSFLGLGSITSANVSFIYIWFVIYSIGFPMVSINAGPMVVELAKDRDTGRYMGYYYIAATVAQIITPTLASVFIETLGFGYGSITWYAFTFSTLGAVCCMFIKLGDAKPIMREALELASEEVLD